MRGTPALRPAAPLSTPGGTGQTDTRGRWGGLPALLPPPAAPAIGRLPRGGAAGPAGAPGRWLRPHHMTPPSVETFPVPRLENGGVGNGALSRIPTRSGRPPTSPAAPSAMTRWVPTKREEKYGVGEDPPGPAPACCAAPARGEPPAAGLTPPPPLSLPQPRLPRSRSPAGPRSAPRAAAALPRAAAAAAPAGSPHRPPPEETSPAGLRGARGGRAAPAAAPAPRGASLRESWELGLETPGNLRLGRPREKSYLFFFLLGGFFFPESYSVWIEEGFGLFYLCWFHFSPHPSPCWQLNRVRFQRWILGGSGGGSRGSPPRHGHARLSLISCPPSAEGEFNATEGKGSSFRRECDFSYRWGVSPCALRSGDPFRTLLLPSLLKQRGIVLSVLKTSPL